MKNYIILSVLMSVGTYLLLSFIYWDITIIKRLPDLSTFDRFMCMLGYFMKEVLTAFFYDTVLKPYLLKRTK